MTAEIIAVGTELLLGDIVNTNAAFLARELAALGFDLFHQSVVGDNRARLSESIRTALARSDLVVLCGGLGPTEDDLTRETAAETLGVPLVHDAAVQSAIDAYFAGRHMCETANNRRQAMILAGGRVLANPNGTAPGQLLQKDGRTLVLLPGPPNEFCPMVTGTLCPLLAGLTGSTIHSRTLRVFGIGEADLEYHLRDELQSANPTAACYCKPGEVHLRITAKAATEAEAEALVEQKAAVLRSRIGDRIYSECGRSLPETVVDLLRERQLTVTVAESITGAASPQTSRRCPARRRCFPAVMSPIRRRPSAASWASVPKRWKGIPLSANRRPVKWLRALSRAAAPISPPPRQAMPAPTAHRWVWCMWPCATAGRRRSAA